MSDFRAKTIRGIGWSVVSQTGRQALTLIVGIILARLLSPADFGLAGMVTVITGFAPIFCELGLSAALVQKQEVTREHFSSVFWANLAAGTLLTLLLMAGAPSVAAFYGEPRLVPITLWGSLNFLIGSLAIIQAIQLSRALNFRALAIVEIISVALSGGTSIVMAFRGWGVWSLVAGNLILTSANAALLWMLNDWRPQFIFRKSVIRDLWGFSSHYLGNQTIYYWTRNLDSILIGRYVGETPLGLYNRASSIMLVPIINIGGVVSRVMFPAFSRIQADKPLVKELYLTLTRVIALLTFPMMLGTFAVAEPFVLVIFGTKQPEWLEMVPLLRVLCLAGAVQAPIILNPNLFLSQGRTDQQFLLGLCLRFVMLLGFIIGLRWGALGVAYGLLISSIFNTFPAIALSGRLVGLRFAEWVRNLMGTLACAAAMSALVWILDDLLLNEYGPWPRLGGDVLIGMISYAGLLVLFRVAAYRDLLRIVLEHWPRFRTSPTASNPRAE